MWFQIIEYARDAKKPVVLVTDDAKGDWWWTLNGQALGPRPELVEEFVREARNDFYMYPTHRFLKYAGERRVHAVDENAIEEARDVRDEMSRTAHRLRQLASPPRGSTLALDREGQFLMAELQRVQREIPEAELDFVSAATILQDLESSPPRTDDPDAGLVRARRMELARDRAANCERRVMDLRQSEAFLEAEIDTLSVAARAMDARVPSGQEWEPGLRPTARPEASGGSPARELSTHARAADAVRPTGDPRRSAQRPGVTPSRQRPPRPRPKE